MAGESRTFRMDRETRDELTSDDFERQRDAVLALPEALSEQEVLMIGFDVSQATAPDAIKEGETLGRRVVFQLGLLAVLYNGDTVTAQNAAKTLKRTPGGLREYFILKRIMKTIPKKLSESEQRMVDLTAELNDTVARLSDTTNGQA